MKWYGLFCVSFVFYTQTEIRRPLFRRLAKKRICHQKVIRATKSANLVKKVKKENITNESIDSIQLSDDYSAITYDLNGGRFGDNLSSYCRAIWIAYHYNIPLLYKPFKYSNQLMLHSYGWPMTKKINEKFRETIVIPNHNYYDIKQEGNILYVIGWRSRTPANWDDKQFVDLVKKCIALSSPSPDIAIPSQHISVAVHIRTGGNYKPDKGIRLRQPKRFAPIEFYFDQLKRIKSMFEGKPLYVHVFTDDSHPMSFIQQFKQELGEEGITYGCRKKNNNFNVNVLEDFFAMTKFDCLIRPESLYSIYAERLGNHQVVIYPIQTGFCREKKIVTIKEIGIKEKTPQGYVTKTIRIW